MAGLEATFIASRRQTDAELLRMLERSKARLATASPARHRLEQSPPMGRSRGAVLLVLPLAIALSGIGVAKARADDRTRRCAPVPVVVDVTHAPPSVRTVDDVHEALRRVGEASGLTFVDSNAHAKHSVDALLIEWRAANDGVFAASGGVLVGMATARWDGSGRYRGPGAIYLNAGASLPSGFADRRSWGGVLLHEAGHVVGLAHAVGPADLMYPGVTAGPTTWGPTDHVELAAAGRRLGCDSRSG